MKFTVFFDPPYWIGLLEVERDGCLYAARHVFGAKPQDEAIYIFVLRDLAALQNGMTVGVPRDPAHGPKQVNPKRRQREIRRELERQGVTHKAYEAVRLQLGRAPAIGAEQARTSPGKPRGARGRTRPSARENARKGKGPPPRAIEGGGGQPGLLL